MVPEWAVLLPLLVMQLFSFVPQFPQSWKEMIQGDKRPGESVESPRNSVKAYYVQAEGLAWLLQVEGLPVCALPLWSWYPLAAVGLWVSHWSVLS